MNVRFLETFYWLATLKSVTKTARHLRIGQPVVSMRLATLQRDLGVELYTGMGRTFELTVAGRRIFPKCEAMVNLANDIEADARDTLLGRDSIRIGLSDVIALSWLPQLLSEMERAHLSAHITTGRANELMEAVREDSIDVALAIGPVTEPSLYSVPLCEFPIEWVTAPSLVAERMPETVQDLARLPIIQSRRSSYRYEKMREYFEWHGVQNLDGLRPNHWMDVGFSIITCAHLASEAVGVTALPIAIVSRQINDGRLTRLPIKETFKPWQIVAAIKKAKVNVELIQTTLSQVKLAVSLYASQKPPELFRPLVWETEGKPGG
ncbi:MAG: LysR family transcriptional regulator [Rhizorhabdus sp.]|uniref:LysR family transcriptional regulator n=1 Tax=Rhizorhabdus sp. TaxID=1968843 RepID=UPI001B6B19AF|nr:LysR family transcriptional regulator [Rhizorhabdus sp.]MBP8232854.1 LysR family transcriptional regulator [Rhizorhabdus sp.]